MSLTSWRHYDYRTTSLPNATWRSHLHLRPRELAWVDRLDKGEEILMVLLRFLSGLLIILCGIGLALDWENAELLLVASLIFAIQSIALAIKERK